jgi:hypothetical protein
MYIIAPPKLELADARSCTRTDRTDLDTGTGSVVQMRVPDLRIRCVPVFGNFGVGERQTPNDLKAIEIKTIETGGNFEFCDTKVQRPHNLIQSSLFCTAGSLLILTFSKRQTPVS